MLAMMTKDGHGIFKILMGALHRFALDNNVPKLEKEPDVLASVLKLGMGSRDVLSAVYAILLENSTRRF